jgi:hypothetical protein
VRQKLAFLVGLATGLALVRLLRGRRSRAPEEPRPDARAEELRRRLAETRSAPEPEPVPAETLVEPPAPAGEPGLDDARKRVHEDARSAAEEMRRSAEKPPP